MQAPQTQPARSHGNRQSWCRPGPDSIATERPQPRQAALPLPQPGPQHHPAEWGADWVGGQCRAAPQCAQQTSGLLAPGSCQPKPRPSRVGDAKLSWPPRAKAPAPPPYLPPPRHCNPGLECLSSLLTASGAQGSGPRRLGLLGMSAWVLSSAAKCTHGPPQAFDAFSGSSLRFRALSSVSYVPFPVVLQTFLCLGLSPSSPSSLSNLLLQGRLQERHGGWREQGAQDRPI